MKAFILAAGDGTRMQPLTASMPKSLLPVAGKPLIQHMLETLKASKVRDITILVGPGRRHIEQEFGDGSDLGINLEYTVQKNPLGTGNAIGCARETIDGPFLAINGDIILNLRTVKNILAHYRKKKDQIVTGFEVANPSEYGVFDMRDGRVASVVEKSENPPSNLANAGIYLFTPEVHDYIDRTPVSIRGEYEITDTLNLMAPDFEIHCETFDGKWVDVGRPWDLLGANKILMEGMEPSMDGEIQPNATIEGDIILGRGSRILNGSYITGPVIIGENTVIGPNCYIRPSTYIGNNCKVGNAVEIKNSILMDGAKAPHHNYVGDSVIGPGCNLGCGTKIANLRLDGRNIRASLKGRMVDTGLRKFGVIMGQGVKTGINVSIDPGTIIGQNSFIGPGTTASGSISPNSKIY